MIDCRQVHDCVYSGKIQAFLAAIRTKKRAFMQNLCIKARLRFIIQTCKECNDGIASEVESPCGDLSRRQK